MKKKVKLPNRMVFRYGDGTQYWIDKGMELDHCTNVSRFIRNAIAGYTKWLIISDRLHQKGDENE